MTSSCSWFSVKDEARSATGEGIRNKCSNVIQFKYFVSSSSSECSAQGQVLHCKRKNLGCSSAEGRSPKDAV